MSRSNPNLQNPAQHFFEWAGSTGTLQFYDKEKKENIKVPLPFEFLVLDELSTITGYNKPAQSGFWSNEVRNTQKEELTVRSKAGIEYVGLYKNDQGIVQMPRGANYTRSIYIAHKTKTGEYIIGNLKAAGSARSAWFEFIKTCKPQNGKVIMTKGKQQEAQTGPFFPPVFEYVSSTPEEDSEAIRLDKELQIYLNQYLSAPKQEDDRVEDHSVDPNVGLASPAEVADFEERKAAKLSPKEDRDEDRAIKEMLKNDEAESINIDDIPF